VLILSQGLFSLPHSASEEKHKKMGGSTARTADPSWPKGYSIPYDVMLSTQTGDSRLGGCNRCSRMGWVWVSGWWAIALCITRFVYSIIIVVTIIIISPFAVLLNCLYLNPRVLLFFPFSSPSHRCGERSERMAAWCLVVGWG